MELKGQYSLKAAREAVWSALGDPDVLANCIPGCESVERVADGEMKAVVAVEVGPFTSRFTGTVKLSEANPPMRWTLEGEGRGRPSGSARGNLSFELAEEAGGTIVNYLGFAEVGGKLGDVADHLGEAPAREMAEAFFASLSRELDRKDWVDELDHSPAGVQLGDEESEAVVIDKAEEAGEAAESVEERIELAAGQQVLGGPMVWGLLAVILLIIILVLVY